MTEEEQACAIAERKAEAALIECMRVAIEFRDAILKYSEGKYRGWSSYEADERTRRASTALGVLKGSK